VILGYTLNMEIKDVENLAELARIKLTEEEKKELLSDMDSILGYIKQIEEIKVEDVEPEYRVHNILREDLPAEAGGSMFPDQELITSQFPDSKDEFLRVKKIL